MTSSPPSPALPTRSPILLLPLLLLLTVFTWLGARGQDISLVYTIDEEKPQGTFVGDVAHDSNIRDLVGSEQEFRALTYRFLAEGSNITANFRLQGDSGDLTTKKVLDRESLCRFQKDCRLQLRLAAQSALGLFFKIIDVTVVLNDVNDNAPVFSPALTELTVFENADVGQLFQEPSAPSRSPLPPQGALCPLKEPSAPSRSPLPPQGAICPLKEPSAPSRRSMHQEVRGDVCQ
ncbi:hypothetical protein ACOMHN_031220 [Nucella lapillus]